MNGAPDNCHHDRSEDRARGLRWLQDNADQFLDFDVLEERERSGL